MGYIFRDFCNKWHIPDSGLYICNRQILDTRLYPEVTYKFTFVRSSVCSFIHPFLTLMFQNWLIRFFCFVTQITGSISAQSWWSPIFRKKSWIAPNWEKRVQNYSQMQEDRGQWRTLKIQTNFTCGVTYMFIFL